VGEFRALIAADPGYAYAYFHGGQTLERLGRPEEARELYRQGIEAAQRKAISTRGASCRGAGPARIAPQYFCEKTAARATNIPKAICARSSY